MKKFIRHFVSFFLVAVMIVSSNITAFAANEKPVDSRFLPEITYTEDNTSYKKDAYVLKDSVAEDEHTLRKLKEILQIPMMMTSGIESGSDTTKQMEEKLKEQMSQGMSQGMPQSVPLDDMSMFDLLKMLPAEQRTTMVEKIEEQMSEMPDTILDQAAVSFCRSAYKDLGMDMDQTQIHYSCDSATPLRCCS